jgi:hypothetical protein
VACVKIEISGGDIVHATREQIPSSSVQEMVQVLIRLIEITYLSDSYIYSNILE